MNGKSLLLVPVGNLPHALMRELAEPIQVQLGVQVVHAKVQLQSPAYALNKDRKQYHSTAIMRRLGPLKEPGQTFVMGITDVDLFVPDATFVFGEADRESRVALLSTFRLKSNGEGAGFTRRMQIEAVHQGGHLVGLSYCDDPRCVMFMATTPSDCDRKQLVLCNVCRNELVKLAKN